MQTSLRQLIQNNIDNNTAIGHFNIPDLLVAQSVIDAAILNNVPIILGVSEGEREFIGLNQIVTFVKSFKDKNIPIFLNADHTYSYEKIMEAVNAGFDMVIYDGADKTIEENIKIAQKCKQYIDNYNKQNNTDILFEAELGYIGTGSQLRTELPNNLQMTTVEEALHYINQVKCDLLAPAIGNVHGMLKDIPEPNLNEKRCGEIYNATKIPLVLHGASGNSKEDIQACIKNGVAIVHISTELRVAYKEALKKNINESNELAAYKYLKPVKNAVKELVTEKIKIFNSK